MKVTGSEKLNRKLRKLPRVVRDDLAKAVHRNTEAGARVARVLAPVESGKTKREIVTQYKDQGLTGIVEAIDPQADRKDKDRAYSIEHGRKKGDRGTTKGSEHMKTTRKYMADRWKRSMATAVRKAVRKVAGNV